MALALFIMFYPYIALAALSTTDQSLIGPICMQYINGSREIIDILEIYTNNFKGRLNTLYPPINIEDWIDYLRYVPISVQDRAIHNCENFKFIKEVVASKNFPQHSSKLIDKRVYLSTYINQLLTDNVKDTITILRKIKSPIESLSSFRVNKVNILTANKIVIDHKTITYRKIISRLKIIVSAVARRQPNIIDSLIIPLDGIYIPITNLSDSWVINIINIGYSLTHENDGENGKIINKYTAWLAIWDNGYWF